MSKFKKIMAAISIYLIIIGLIPSEIFAFAINISNNNLSRNYDNNYNVGNNNYDTDNDIFDKVEPEEELDNVVDVNTAVNYGVTNALIQLLDKNSNNIVQFDNEKDKVSVVFTDIESLKEGKGNLLIKIGKELEIKIPFTAIDKSYLENAEKLEFLYEKSDSTPILKSLNVSGLSKVFNFELLIHYKDGTSSKSIHNFVSGTEVKIILKCTNDDFNGLDKSKLKAYYYNEESKKTEAMSSEISDNNISFITNHFSKYIVADNSNNNIDNEDNEIVFESGSSSNTASGSTSNSTGSISKTGDINSIEMLQFIFFASGSFILTVLIGMMVIDKRYAK